MVKIIYLNGPSSSGKTTLAKALQEALKEPFLCIGIDKMIGLMPAKLNCFEGGEAPLGFSMVQGQDSTGHPIYTLKTGPFAKRIIRTLKEITLLLAAESYHLIIDDVAFGAIEVEEWKEALKPYPVLYVGVVAPLEVLEERERTRENRPLGSARSQYFKVHENVAYDLEVNTHTNTLQDNVLTIQRALESMSI